MTFKRRYSLSSFFLLAFYGGNYSAAALVAKSNASFTADTVCILSDISAKEKNCNGYSTLYTVELSGSGPKNLLPHQHTYITTSQLGSPLFTMLSALLLGMKWMMLH